MQLSYRGVRYTRESTPVDMIDSGMVGTYRGQTFPITYPRHMPVQQAVHNLVYRGTAYRTTATGGTVAVERVVENVPVRPAAPSGSVAPIRRIPSEAYETTHRSNIQRRLQQRIEAAKARGDQKLLSLLEHEMQQAS